jgi:hypothetical protein
LLCLFFFWREKYSVKEYIAKMVSKQNQPSNSTPSEYVKGMEKLSKLAGFDHQNAIVFSVLIGEIKALDQRMKKMEEYSPRLEKLERRLTNVEDDVDDLDNRVDAIFSKEYGRPVWEDSSSESFSDSGISVHTSKISDPIKKRKYPGKKGSGKGMH